MELDEDFCFIQFRVPRSFKYRFQDWCDSQGVTMSGALVCWIADRERIGLPTAITKPWKNEQ